MGRQSAQEELFYQFRLEDHVPVDHMLRRIDAVLNFDGVRTLWPVITVRRGGPRLIPN